jgi:hypothetical protein
MMVPSPSLLTALITKFELFHSSMCAGEKDGETNATLSIIPSGVLSYPSRVLSYPSGVLSYPSGVLSYPSGVGW